MATLNPYTLVHEFEETIAKWAGSKYAIAVESCSAALFLCCEYLKVKEVTIPKNTYPSVPCSIINAGGTVKFSDEDWEGLYELKPYNIWDGALRFQPGMYKGGLHCLSFHMKKHLPIGRGGMILTDDENAYKWFKRARFDGRDELPLQDDKMTQIGWNMYMTVEQAARGLQLFSTIRFKSLEDLPVSEQGYPDLSQYPIYTARIRGADPLDAEFLLSLKNDPQTLKYSIATKEPITLEDHKEWLEKRIFNPEAETLVIDSGSGPVGTVRLDYLDDEVEFALAIDRKHWNKGLGSWAIREVCQPGVKYMAKIVDGNIGSQKIFEKNGFVKVRHIDGERPYSIYEGNPYRLAGK